MGTKKREERKERAEQARQHAERMKAQKRLRSRLMVIGGVLVVLAVGFLATRRGGGNGRVWSAEHGHWHDQ